MYVHPCLYCDGPNDRDVKLTAIARWFLLANALKKAKKKKMTCKKNDHCFECDQKEEF